MSWLKIFFVGAGAAIASGTWTGHTWADQPFEAQDASALVASPIRELPIAMHRRAARYFEAMRRTSDSPWFDAHLADRATPIARSGVHGPAYYEVPVEGPGGEARGYLLLSNGDHDFPVAGAQKGGPPATVKLADLARSRGVTVARVTMPSLFAFVAENAQGEVVAQIGGLPAKVDGLDRSVLDLPPEARAGRTVAEPGQAPRVERPAALAHLRYSSWSSWREYLGERDRPDALDMEVMRRSAVPMWEEEAQAATTADELDPRGATRVSLLARGDATFAVRGTAADRVSAERVEGPAGEAWVRLRAISTPEVDTEDLSLEIAYASGEREVLGFAIAPRLRAAPRVLGQAVPTCRRVALRTRRGYFLRAVNGGRAALDAGSDTVGPWETWELLRQPDGTLAFQSGPSGFVVYADEKGTVEVFSSGVGARGKFTPVAAPFALRASHGRFLSAVGGGGGAVTATAAAPGPDERFSIMCDPPPPASTFPWARDEADAWAKQRKYRQVDGNTTFNKSGCVSGCGATAWAMLVGYSDYVASMGHPRFGPFDRMYLANNGRGRSAPDAVAPEKMDAGIEQLTIELRDDMNDGAVSGCTITGSRFTSPVIMAQANEYFWGRVPARVIAEYDGAGIGTIAGATNVVNSLRAGHVTAIGTGHLSHYPVAFGMHNFTPRRWSVKDRSWIQGGGATTVFEVNWGSGEDYSTSVPLHSWFKGIVDVAPYSRVDAVVRDCTLRAQSGAIADGARMDRDYLCRTHLRNDERHVAMEVAGRLLERDVIAQARARRLKVCMLKQTDIQCAPCSTTDRLIVRITSVASNKACPADTVNPIQC